jgi:hypothetical protein
MIWELGQDVQDSSSLFLAIVDEIASLDAHTEL